jgi:hypothetical protein
MAELTVQLLKHLRNKKGLHLAMAIREQAPGAWPNGTRVEKTIFGKNDAHHPGDRGTVLGSIGAPQGIYGYFVEWDDTPGISVLVISTRIAKCPS